MNDSRARQRILVTGGAGFVGSHLVGHLCSRGAAVTIIDDLSTGSLRNLVEVRDGGANLEFIEGRAGAAINGLDARSFSAVYHLAAAVGVQLVLEKTAEAVERNVIDTSSVLRWAASAGVPTLITSSSEVYGRGVRSPFREEDDVVYGPTTALRWSYACSKALDEYLALAHYHAAGLPATVVRLFNTVGPRQTGRYGMVLPRFVRSALNGQPLEVYGDGRQSRCFCDVRDVVPAIVALLESSASRGRVFNVGSHQSTSIGDLARLVVATLGSSSPVVNVPYAEAYGPGFDDLQIRQPDLTRIRETISFAPRIALTQTITDIAAQITRVAAEAPR